MNNKNNNKKYLEKNFMGIRFSKTQTKKNIFKIN